MLYAIDPGGRLVLVAAVPSTHRLATDAEFSRAKQLANPPTEAPPVSDPAPDPVKGWNSKTD